MKKPVIIILTVLLAFASLQAQVTETKQQHDQRMAWWREAKFGLFIHWGIYSVPAGTYNGKQIAGIGEWIMNRGKIPVAEYAKYAGQFNPVKYNAEQWVLMAKNAGMKYIVITSKHHDGFAMFKSDASNYNIFDASPFKRDAIKELSEACKKHGMKLGLYYSQAQDWHHAGGAANGGQWDPAQAGDMDAYLDKIAVPQVKEILTKYGPISMLWWDTPTNMTKERAEKFQPLLKLQPGIITNNRLGGGFEGDLSTPEQYIPATGTPGKDFEVCMTMNDTWGFKSYDDKWKSTEDLIRKLADIASKGGNFLLNVGPTSEGLIPEPSVERLAAVGKWMKVNGESVYGTSSSPFAYLKWGRATRKGQTLYLHVFNWPSNGTLNVPLQNKIKKAYLLADPKKSLVVKQEGQHVSIKLPASAPDAIDSVIAVQFVGEPVAPPIPTTGKAGKASSSLDAKSGPAMAFDKDQSSSWKAAKGEKSGWLEVTFDKPESIGAVAILETSGRNATIAKFRLEYKDGEQWKTVYEGTRIGRAYNKSFDAVKAQTFRLNILEAGGPPQIADLQLFIED